MNVQLTVKAVIHTAKLKINHVVVSTFIITETNTTTRTSSSNRTIENYTTN